MDRQIEYPGEILTEVELLTIQRNIYTALAYLSQAAVGLAVGQIADGFACTPTSPLGLTVQVAPGAVYSQQARDPNAYSSLGVDTTNNIVKQGINLGASSSQPYTVLSCPAPATAGQSINYLVQVVFGESDSNSAVLSYFNATMPSTAWSGPNNTGAPQNTTRVDGVTISVVAGTAATTGTQTTPAATGGAIGLWVVTVANGQATITTSNISLYPGAPLLNSAYKLPTLPATIQQQPGNYAADTGTANAYVVTLSPPPANWNALIGSPIRFKVANANTLTACTVNVNGLGIKSLIGPDGAPLPTGSLIPGAVVEGVYDGNNVQMVRLAGPPVAECYLKFTSSTQVTLVPSGGGNRLFNPSSGMQSIPSTGVVATSTSCYLNGTLSALGNNTNYWIYEFSNAGVPTLDFCTAQVSTTLDTLTGMPIKSGDNSRVLVGFVRTNGSSQFTPGNVLSYWNRRNLVGYINQTWSTSSSSPVATAVTVSFPTWGDEVVSYIVDVAGSNATAGDGWVAYLYLDGSVVAGPAGWTSITAGAQGHVPLFYGAFAPEGAHTVTMEIATVGGSSASGSGTLVVQYRG